MDICISNNCFFDSAEGNVIMATCGIIISIIQSLARFYAMFMIPSAFDLNGLSQQMLTHCKSRAPTGAIN